MTIRTRVAVLTVAVLVAAAHLAAAHPAPPPGTGGWTPNTTHHGLRPDGLPVTHYCGRINFSIDDGGNGGVGAEMRNVIWSAYLVSGQDFHEVPPGQVVTGIELHYGWPAGGGAGSGWTKTRYDGWNFTRNESWVRPGVPLQRLRHVIIHEFGHALGMGHNTVNGSVENTAQVNDQWHMSDGAALLYLTGHPPAPGEPCWRAG